MVNKIGPGQFNITKFVTFFFCYFYLCIIKKIIVVERVKHYVHGYFSVLSYKICLQTGFIVLWIPLQLRSALPFSCSREINEFSIKIMQWRHYYALRNMFAFFNQSTAKAPFNLKFFTITERGDGAGWMAIWSVDML